MAGSLAGYSVARAGRVVQARVKIGCCIVEGIIEAAASSGVELGAIVGACGAVENATFRNLKYMPGSYPVKPDNHCVYEIGGPLEIVSLSGWFSVTPERRFVHVHCSASAQVDGKPVVYGGHLLRAKAGSKVVVTLLETAGGTAHLGFDSAESMTDDLVFDQVCSR